MYYDGKIEFTRIRVDKRTNGGNEFRADWYCPKCGMHRCVKWGGHEDSDPVGYAIATYCSCGLAVEAGSFIKVVKLSEAAMKPLAVVPLRGPSPPEKIVCDGVESYVCGCCGIEGDDLAPGDRVDVHYMNGQYVGSGELLSFHSQSQGHQIWDVKFDDDGETHSYGRGCLRKRTPQAV